MGRSLFRLSILLSCGKKLSISLKQLWIFFFSERFLAQDLLGVSREVVANVKVIQCIESYKVLSSFQHHSQRLLRAPCALLLRDCENVSNYQFNSHVKSKSLNEVRRIPKAAILQVGTWENWFSSSGTMTMLSTLRSSPDDSLSR